MLKYLVLPVCMEMVLFYCVCIFCCAVRGTGWKLNLFWKKKVEDTDLAEEVGADLAVEEADTDSAFWYLLGELFIVNIIRTDFRFLS